jgi:hypothetical protein
MKLNVKHFDPEGFRSKLGHLNHLDISIFVDDIPRLQEDLSLINVLVLQEPNDKGCNPFCRSFFIILSFNNDLGIFRSIQFLNKSCLVFFLSWGERMDSHELFGGSNYEALFFRTPD